MFKSLLPIVYLFLFFSTHAIFSQTPINKRFVEDFTWGNITGVAATDTAYYASGLCGSDPWGSAFYTFDLDGHLIHTKILKDSSILFDFWCRNLIPTERNSFLAGGWAGNYNNGRAEGLLAEYFPALDSIRYHLFVYDDPVYENKFGGVFKFDYADGEILLSPNVNHPDVWNSEALIFRFNLDFELLETKFFYHPKRDGFGVVKAINNTTYLATYLEDQGDFRYSEQIWFRAFNENWELINEYLSPEEEIWGAPGDFEVTSDGGFIIGTQSGYQHHFPSGSDSMSIPFFYPYVLKLSADLEREWSMQIGTGQIGWGMIEDIYKDNDEYIVAGSINDFPIDSIFSRRFGVIAKLNESGDKLWERKLYWMDTTKHSHYIYSIAPTNDNGYLLGGEINGRVSNDPFEPTQQSWLLKVDEYGCLVPGCQGPVASVELNKKEVTAPLLFPNPARNRLSVFIPAQPGFREGEISITDASGKLMHEYKRVVDDTTYLLDIANWPSGIYYLKYAVSKDLFSVVKWVKI